jgi:hypothetical protein
MSRSWRATSKPGGRVYYRRADGRAAKFITGADTEPLTRQRAFAWLRTLQRVADWAVACDDDCPHPDDGRGRRPQAPHRQLPPVPPASSRGRRNTLNFERLRRPCRFQRTVFGLGIG